MYRLDSVAASGGDKPWPDALRVIRGISNSYSNSNSNNNNSNSNSNNNNSNDNSNNSNDSNNSNSTSTRNLEYTLVFQEKQINSDNTKKKQTT